mgnify:CR=1 FL=1
MTRLALISLLVADYDQALHFYIDKLNFELLEDTRLTESKRWVRIRPPGGGGGAELLLAKAATPEQQARVGDQTGGRVFLFLETDDFDRDYDRMMAAGVRFHGEPRVEPYGKVVVFEDLYGNKWDLIQPAETQS